MSNSVTVSTRKEFENEVKNNTDKIIVTGNLAKEIIAAQKKKSRAKKLGIGSAILAGVVGLAGVVAAPITGGASLAATAVCSKVVITTGTVTVAAGTVDVVAGVLGILGVMGIAKSIVDTVGKNYDVRISSDATKVEFTRK